MLERDQPGRAWPAASTMGALLKREGLVVAPKKRRHTAAVYAAAGARRGMQSGRCADLKRWFRTGAGEGIDALTLSHAYSRYLLRYQAVEKTNAERVRAFEALFSRVWIAAGDTHRQRSPVCLR